MASHHKMGMSKWTPWNCCAHFDSVEDSAAARKGTEAHDRLRRYLTGDKTLELDETQQADRAVKWAGDYIRQHADGRSVAVEERVEIAPSLSESLAGIYGTVDAFDIESDTGEEVDAINIYDFKSLSSDHATDLFPQLAGYAIGVASLVGIANRNTKVRLHVLFGGDFSVEVKDATLDLCIAIGEQVVNERKHNEGMPHVTNHWCRYCKHSMDCPGVDTLTETVKSGGLASLSAPKRLAVIDELEAILKRAKEVAKAEIALRPNKTWEDEGIRYAIREVNGPSSVAEGKMVELFNACASVGVDADAVMSVCKVGKSDICRVIKEKAGLKVKSKDPNEVTAESVVAPFFTCRQVEKLVREA